MLNNLSAEIRECYRHALDCARQAAAQTDPNLKQDFLDMERRWLYLARSYDFTQSLNDFSNETKTASRQIAEALVGSNNRRFPTSSSVTRNGAIPPFRITAPPARS